MHASTDRIADERSRCTNRELSYSISDGGGGGAGHQNSEAVNATPAPSLYDYESRQQSTEQPNVPRSYTRCGVYTATGN